MKYIKILAFAFLTISMIGCKPTDTKKTETSSSNQPAKLITSYVTIEGMTCEIGCAKTIESKIAKLDGVAESKVNFEGKKGTFTYDSNKISEEKIISSINGLLDGKTYKATHANADIATTEACTTNCKMACCAVKEKTVCSKECAEKCEHKEGESCSKEVVEKCNEAKKETCKKACCSTDKK